MGKPKYDWHKIITGIPNYDPYRDSAGFHFDEQKAEKFLEFCRTQLTVWEGPAAGQPFELLDWQKSVAANLFGWVDDSGLRRYREAFIYIAKKAGKSPFIGAIADWMLLCDGEAGPQIYCCACDTDQANIVFRNSWNLMGENEELKSVCNEYVATKQIRCKKIKGFIKVLSSEFKAKDGLNASCVIIDEVHRHDSRDLIDTLMGATSSREQPLTILITTADYDRHSICNDKLKYAKSVIAGTIPDNRFLPVIYEMLPDDDWTDADNWMKSNPSLGVTKSIDYMRRACLKAQNEAGYQAVFRRLECNQMTQSSTTWIQLTEWDACKHIYTDSELTDRPCVMALDLSSTTDLTARAVVYSMPDDILYVDVHCWIPDMRAQEHIQSDRVPYDIWRNQGWITYTEGNSVDYEYIRRDVGEIASQYRAKEVCSDPWNATQLLTQLASDGLTVVEFRQGYASMSPACKEVERRIKAKKIAHNGNPLMRWMVENCMVVIDPAGNLKPDKNKSNGRIDGVVAMIMGVGRAITTVAKKSIYETRGVRSL